MSGFNKKNNYRSQRRPMGRKLRRALGLALVCMGLVGLSGLFVYGYQSLLSSPLLRVARIQVNGCQRLDPETVIQQAEIHPGINILSLDLNDARRRLTAHPWVAAAVISREIPDGIRIDIEERQPIALVRGRDFYLMDREGYCFARAAPGEYPGLPIVSGLDPESVGPGRHLPTEPRILISALHRECQGQLPWRLISEIRWEGDAGLRLFTLRGGIAIALGNSNFVTRLARLQKVLHYLEEKGIATYLRGIDLAYGDRVFVKGNFQLGQQDRLQQRGI